MKTMRAWYLSLPVIIMLLCLVFGGCGTTEDGGAGSTPPGEAVVPTPPEDTGIAPGGQLLVGTVGEVGVLNPILSRQVVRARGPGAMVIQHVFEGLVAFDGRASLLPQLAESWSTSDDETVWTFQLREGVTWHDGTPFTAQDVKFTYDSVLHPLNESPWRQQVSQLKGVGGYLGELHSIDQKEQDGELSSGEAAERQLESYREWLALEAVRAPGDGTVVFTLQAPHAPFLTQAARLGIVPEHILGDTYGPSMLEHEFSHHPVGTGAFVFDELTDAYVSLDRNPHHWASVPHVEGMSIRLMDNSDELHGALEEGNLDAGAITLDAYDRFHRLDHVRTVESPQFNYTYMGMNLNHPLFEERPVRQALAHAINKEAMVMDIYQGLALPAHSHGSPIRWDYNPDVTTFPYDASRAQALLEEAGWKPGADGGLEKDGLPFTFSLTVNRDSSVHLQVAERIKENLADVGITMQVEAVSGQEFSMSLIMRQFEAALGGWELGNDPDALDMWHSEAFLNFFGYTNARMDELLEQGRNVGDLDKRTEIYQEVQAILAEDQPYVFLFFPMSIYGINARIEVDGPLMGSPVHVGPATWNAHDWWIPPAHQSAPIIEP